MLTGLIASSMGLVADSLDMLADGIVCALSLFAIGGGVSRKKMLLLQQAIFNCRWPF